ncbi:MAG: Membrane protein involved in aromatic hydrocarbon degradation [Verrucomicrobiales bacterium]|jgi:long-chain fatty acid transport protein|nr:Membrane protein involved in aromatic hydrocarbon degradation [Verrucomicrobiales bacterium]
MSSNLKRLLVTAPLWSSMAYGLGLRIPDQDAEAIARGNAFAATADNPAAVYYNPAGITQIPGQQISVGGYTINLHSYYTSPKGNDTETKSKIAMVPEIFYTASFKEYPISVGFGFYSPYGLGLEWPDNDTFHALRGKMEYLTMNPVVAWKICDTLSIAAGPTLNYAKTDFRQTLLPNGNGQIRFKGDDTDAGFNAGILWHPLTQHSFGFNYFSATKINFDGDVWVKGAGPSATASASAEFKLPQHLVAGYSFRPTENWNLEFDIDWTDWDSLNTVTLVSPLGNKPLPFNWKSSFLYEFGVTRYFGEKWKVSAGYIYSENSVPEANLTPLVPDSDRHIFSVGVGRQFEHWSWNAAYQLAWGPERDVTASNPLTFPIGSSANGRYTFLSHALSFNTGYRF